jgi:hypothetical protein
MKISEMKKILNETKKKGKIHNWIISQNEISKQNLYLGLNFEDENFLQSKVEQIEIRIFKIYKDNDKNKDRDKIGQTNFVINYEDKISTFKKKLKEAIFVMSKSLSKKWELPKKGDEILDDKKIKYKNYFNEIFFKEFEKGNLENLVLKKLQILKEKVLNFKHSLYEIEVNSIEFFNTILKNNFYASYSSKKSFKKMELILN